MDTLFLLCHYCHVNPVPGYILEATAEIRANRVSSKTIFRLPYSIVRQLLLHSEMLVSEMNKRPVSNKYPLFNSQNEITIPVG